MSSATDSGCLDLFGRRFVLLIGPDSEFWSELDVYRVRLARVWVMHSRIKQGAINVVLGKHGCAATLTIVELLGSGAWCNSHHNFNVLVLVYAFLHLALT